MSVTLLECRICGKSFLTTNARHTKYCGGYAPGDKLHRTGEIGDLKGREQQGLRMIIHEADT